MMKRSILCLHPPSARPTHNLLPLSEMTIGGSSCAPSESHRGSGSAGRRAGWRTDGRAGHNAAHGSGEGRENIWGLRRISYAHPQCWVEANALTPRTRRGWAGLRRPPDRLHAVSPTISSCVEWTRRRAWSRTMEQVGGNQSNLLKREWRKKNHNVLFHVMIHLKCSPFHACLCVGVTSI